MERSQNSRISSVKRVCPSVRNPATTSTSPLLPSERSNLEHQQVFGYTPRNCHNQARRQGQRRQGSWNQATAKRSRHSQTWTRTFVCLSGTTDERMPSSEEYICLRKASLGEKRIVFNLDSSTAAFDAKLKNEYPKLDLAGGYVLMCGTNATCKLFAISPPYTVWKLK